MDYSRTEKGDLWLRLFLDGSYKEEVEEFKSLDTSGVTFSKSYYKKKRHIVSGLYWKPILASIKATSMKAAMVFLVVLSLGFVTVLAIPSSREATFNIIEEWFDDHKEIVYVENSDQSSEKPLDKIETINKPAVLPNGVEEEVLACDDTLYLSEYYLDGEWIATFTQELKADALKVVIDTENRIIYKLVINEKEVEIFEKTTTGDITAYWQDKHYVYFIDALDLDVILDLIYGIEESR